MKHVDTDRLKFSETIDVEACKYMLSLTAEQFKKDYCTGEWKECDGEKIASDVRVYRSEVQKFCNRMISKDGEHKPVYKYGKNRSSGRVYTEEFGIQRLSKPLRDLLVPEKLIDYDMVNCHPTLLLHLAKSYGLSHHYLEEYVTNRDAILDKSNNTKKSILVFMNLDKVRRTGNPWTDAFVGELKIIKSELYERVQKNYPSTNKKNPVSSCVNKLLCDQENKLLQTAIQHFLKEDDVCAPMFDGFMCTKDIHVDDLNKLSVDMGVTWKVKDWTKIAIPEDFDRKGAMSYESIKRQFEETHSVVKSPALWVVDGEFRTKQEFEFSALEYQYVDKMGKTKDLFPEWARDKNKKKYDTVVCTPYNPRQQDPTPDNVLNVASPFAFKYIEKEERNPTALADFKHILAHICCSEDTQVYMLNFFAQLLQFPGFNPMVAPLIKGHHGGVGKDSVFKTMKALLGIFWVASVDDMETVFGKFNSMLDHKLLVQLNEAEGGQGAKFINKIKGHVTADDNLIKEEHIKVRAQTNLVRYFVNSNNLNPIPYDRRLCIIQTLVHKLISREWWSDYYKNKLPDQHFLDSLGSELLDIDLTGFDITTPPETAGSRVKKSQKTLHVHVVFQKIAEGKSGAAGEVVKLTEPEGWVGFNKSWLVQQVANTFMTAGDKPPTQKALYNMVDSWGLEYPQVLDIEPKRRYVEGVQRRLVAMDPIAMVKALKNDGRYTSPVEDVGYEFK